MAKSKRKRSVSRSKSRHNNRKRYGKRPPIPPEPTIDGIPVDEFILRNADPIWLHQNEMWEYILPIDGGTCTWNVYDEDYKNDENYAGDEDDLPF